MIAMHHAIFGRNPIIVNNLLTMSEGNVTTYPVRGNVSNAPISIVGFDNSVAFGDNSVTRFAYKRNFAAAIGTTYNLSCYIEMEDGGAPVIGLNNTLGDFRFIINSTANTANFVVQLVSGSIYRVSATTTATVSDLSNGIVKYDTQSARKFKISGIQLTEEADLLPYKKTT